MPSSKSVHIHILLYVYSFIDFFTSPCKDVGGSLGPCTNFCLLATSFGRNEGARLVISSIYVNTLVIWLKLIWMSNLGY